MDILQKYEAFASESTDAPSIFHRYCAASMVGTLLGRRVWYQHGHRMLFPHTWISLIAPSGVKKTTALGIAEDFIADANKDLILPSKFSYEKLFMCAAEQPTGIITYSELSALLSLLDRDFNAEAKSNLADWWDSPRIKTYGTKGAGMFTLERPAISMLAATTLAWFEERAKAKDVAGGFYARWLWVVVEKSDKPAMILPPERDQVKYNGILLALREIMKICQYEMHESGKMHLSESGEAEYRRAYADLGKVYGHNETLVPFVTRGQVYVLKLAMISAIARNRSLTMDAADVAYGHELVSAALTGIAKVCEFSISDNKFDANLNRVKKILSAAGAEGVLGSVLLKKSKMGARFLKDLTDTLIATGEVKFLQGKRVDSGWFIYQNGA